MKTIGLLIAVAWLLVHGSGAHATPISTRTQLNSLLGSNAITETFGSILPTSNPQNECDQTFADVQSNVLNSSTVIPANQFQSAQGPGLVSPDISFSTSSTSQLQVWPTSSCAALPGGPQLKTFQAPLDIQFLIPVDAFGLTLAAPTFDNSFADIVSIYGTDGSLLTQVNADSFDCSIVCEPVFFGDSESAQIGSIDISSPGYAVIGDVIFGEVPEPPTILIFITGLMTMVCLFRVRVCSLHAANALQQENPAVEMP